MKKTYRQPEASVTRAELASLICTSVLGIGGSGSPGGARAPEMLITD